MTAGFFREIISVFSCYLLNKKTMSKVRMRRRRNEMFIFVQTKKNNVITGENVSLVLRLQRKQNLEVV